MRAIHRFKMPHSGLDAEVFSGNVCALDGTAHTRAVSVCDECPASRSGARGSEVQPTDTSNPDYFHKVVDCQWACPAHTPVPEYIRLISAGRYSDAYMINWKSNVFPGILGRTCDRP